MEEPVTEPAERRGLRGLRPGTPGRRGVRGARGVCRERLPHPGRPGPLRRLGPGTGGGPPGLPLRPQHGGNLRPGPGGRDGASSAGLILVNPAYKYRPLRGATPGLRGLPALRGPIGSSPPEARGGHGGRFVPPRRPRRPGGGG
ncbi:MAG: hypothetical protein MZV70_69450 [Desulfobacterales bacterium]|nr:hypothetical protein [Desulfobacterales bacterium]